MILLLFRTASCTCLDTCVLPVTDGDSEMMINLVNKCNRVLFIQSNELKFAWDNITTMADGIKTSIWSYVS